MIVLDTQRVGAWVAQKVGGIWDNSANAQAIGYANEDGQLLAGVTYKDWNGANIWVHVRVEDGRALPQFVAVAFHYPFVQVGARRLTLPICSTNRKALSVAARMGFTLESKLNQATPEGDLQLWRMMREDCRFLEGRFADAVRRAQSKGS